MQLNFGIRTALSIVPDWNSNLIQHFYFCLASSILGCLALGCLLQTWSLLKYKKGVRNLAWFILALFMGSFFGLLFYTKVFNPYEAYGGFPFMSEHFTDQGSYLMISGKILNVIYYLTLLKVGFRIGDLCYKRVFSV